MNKYRTVLEFFGFGKNKPIQKPIPPPTKMKFTEKQQPAILMQDFEGVAFVKPYYVLWFGISGGDSLIYRITGKDPVTKEYYAEETIAKDWDPDYAYFMHDKQTAKKMDYLLKSKFPQLNKKYGGMMQSEFDEDNLWDIFKEDRGIVHNFIYAYLKKTLKNMIDYAVVDYVHNNDELHIVKSTGRIISTKVNIIKTDEDGIQQHSTKCRISGLNVNLPV